MPGGKVVNRLVSDWLEPLAAGLNQASQDRKALIPGVGALADRPAGARRSLKQPVRPQASGRRPRSSAVDADRGHAFV
jgi:hypothetical protein